MLIIWGHKSGWHRHFNQFYIRIRTKCKFYRFYCLKLVLLTLELKLPCSRLTNNYHNFETLILIDDIVCLLFKLLRMAHTGMKINSTAKTKTITVIHMCDRLEECNRSTCRLENVCVQFEKSIVYLRCFTFTHERRANERQNKNWFLCLFLFFSLPTTLEEIMSILEFEWNVQTKPLIVSKFSHVNDDYVIWWLSQLEGILTIGKTKAKTK